MTNFDDPELISAKKLNLETSIITWKELERFFASGSTIQVDENLDLIEVSLEIAKDNTALIEQWMSEGKLSGISDQQAQEWHDKNASLWALVIKPWVLVQDKEV